MSEPPDSHRRHLDSWLRFIQSLLWPALAVALLLMFGSDITRLLKHVTHSRPLVSLSFTREAIAPLSASCRRIRTR